MVESIIRAFDRLSFSRPIGMSLGSIPLSEITGYWRNIDQLCGELEDWIDMVQAMDGIFLEFHAPKETK